MSGVFESGETFWKKWLMNRLIPLNYVWLMFLFSLLNVWYSVLSSNCICEQMLFTLNFRMLIATPYETRFDIMLRALKLHIKFMQLNELENLFLTFRLKQTFENQINITIYNTIWIYLKKKKCSLVLVFFDRGSQIKPQLFSIINLIFFYVMILLAIINICYLNKIYRRLTVYRTPLLPPC